MMNTEIVLTTRDEAHWRAVLPATRSVFGSLEFAHIEERRTGSSARLFTLRVAGAFIACPLALRPVSALPFATDLAPEQWDALTPEYTGPQLLAGDLTAAAQSAFRERFDAWCTEQGVVTEFGHLHPWHARRELLQSSGLALDRQIVHVDLTLSEDHLWSESLDRSCRKNLNRARAASVRVFEGTTAEHVREFHRIYTLTMERTRALARYRFPFEYFDAFRTEMPANARFVMAEHGGRVIAGTLFLHDDTDIYAYLGGADYESQNLRPTNALTYSAILWGRERKKQRLVLGGSYSTDGGIFRFKSSFSPLRTEFSVYRRIHLPEKYRALTGRWTTCYAAPVPTDGYFPAYRAQPPAAVATPVL
jgi:hypothetical protein